MSNAIAAESPVRCECCNRREERHYLTDGRCPECAVRCECCSRREERHDLTDGRCPECAVQAALDDEDMDAAREIVDAFDLATPVDLGLYELDAEIAARLADDRAVAL